MMNLLKIHHQPFFCFHFPKTSSSHQPKSLLQFTSSSSKTLSVFKPSFKLSFISQAKTSFLNNEEEFEGSSICNTSSEFDDLAPDGFVYQKTLRLVECSMFAAVAGLVYFLSNSPSIELCFIFEVITSMRWGVAAERKTMVATAMLLLVLSGPVKALAYLLTHGVLSFTMGSPWRMGTNWGLSIFVCTIVVFAPLFLVFLALVPKPFFSKFLTTVVFVKKCRRDQQVTINIHASLTFIFSATGVNIIPSMNVVYAIFGTLALLNCGFFVFLPHLLYTAFLTIPGMRPALKLPGWLQKAAC